MTTACWKNLKRQWTYRPVGRWIYRRPRKHWRYQYILESEWVNRPNLEILDGETNKERNARRQLQSVTNVKKVEKQEQNSRTSNDWSLSIFFYTFWHPVAFSRPFSGRCHTEYLLIVDRTQPALHCLEVRSLFIHLFNHSFFKLVAFSIEWVQKSLRLRQCNKANNTQILTSFT